MKTSFLHITTLAAVIAVSSTLSGLAQNSNPTGSAGRFNALSTTGGSYDPYTLNATRTIPDLTVTGAVGDYPLQWARTMNSRSMYGSYDLGAGGGWSHSYYWHLNPSQIFDGKLGGTPSSYTVYFPNGGVETFAYDAVSGTCSPAFLGIRERFLPLSQDSQGNLLAYLVLPDGGMVEFLATLQWVGDDGGTYTSWYTYQAQAIIDPSGLHTTLTYTNGQLTKVAEPDPASRWLKIYYRTDTGYAGLIDHVDAGYSSTVTQTVTYGYSTYTAGTHSYKTLTSALYSDGKSASYTYQNSNVPPLYDANPLILQCNDVRYPGPMKNISYEFYSFSTCFYGQLSKEKHPSTGAAVVTATMTGNSRTETRGDGKTRTFTYNAAIATTPVQYRQYLLASQTDFLPTTTTHKAAVFTYGAYGHLTSATDSNGHKTSFTHIASTGALLSVTHPLVTGEGTATITYAYEDPTTGYYLNTKTDELLRITTYHHDDAGTMRTTSITYPVGSESFVYNSLNQVTSHTRLTGGVETYTYDSRSRLWKYIPPATPIDGDPNPSANPTIYGYDTDDHLHTIQDPKGNTTTINYNDRGQVTSNVNPDADLSKTTYLYNNDGTVLSMSVDYAANTAATTTYVYDDYKRLKTVTTPLRFTGDTTTPRITKYFYDTGGTGVDDYTHTDSNVTRMVSPGGVVTKNVYNGNHWLLNTTAGYGSGDDATMSYLYDEVGNKKTMTDPKGKSWTYSYDARDRLSYVIDPSTTGRNSLGHTIDYTYDIVSNKKSERRANFTDQVITYDSYDDMNRLTKMTVPQGTNTPAAVTSYSWTNAGKLASMTDPGNASNAPGTGNTYNYTYDALDRLRLTAYPGGSTEVYTYDISGNKATFKNRGGGIQTFSYDTRNREVYYIWNTGSPQARTLVYDDASRITKCNTASTFINFAYYNDNLLKSQEEWTTYYGDSNGTTNHRTITYTYEADGTRDTVAYPGMPNPFVYDYTGRDQLQTMTQAGASVVTYAYDPNGNMATRTPGNGTSSTFAYDEVNRLTDITHNFASATETLHYGHTAAGLRKYVQRNGVNSNADGFSYDLNGEVVTANLGGTLSGTTVTGGAASTYSFDASGNRATMTSGTTTNYTPNNLNQYSNVGGLPVTNEGNGNLGSYNNWYYTYDSMNRLTAVSGLGVYANFYYDGLGRQVAFGASWTPVRVISLWDGWNLAAAYGAGSSTALNRWIYAGNDLIRSPLSEQIYYYPDGLGSTTHLANASGNLVEKYTYDLYGTPTITTLSGGPYDVELLFTGQAWYSQLGLYDLRNRFLHPGLGRFLQPDPVGFAGDSANIYRYVGNNPANAADPNGTTAILRGDHYVYVVDGGPEYLEFLVGARVRARGGGPYLQCAGTCQVLGGGYDTGGVYRDVPQTRTHGNPNWFAGPSLGRDTTVGTIVATNWAPDGSYPNASSGANHTLIFGGFDAAGNAILYSATANTAISRTVVPGDQLGDYNEVNVRVGSGPYGVVSTGLVVVGFDSQSNEPIYEGRVAGSGYGAGAASTGNTWGTPSVGGTTWGNSAYMPGLLASLVPKDRDH